MSARGPCASLTGGEEVFGVRRIYWGAYGSPAQWVGQADQGVSMTRCVEANTAEGIAP